MEVNEVKKRRHNIEIEILNILINFEKEMGVMIHEIRFGREIDEKLKEGKMVFVTIETFIGD